MFMKNSLEFIVDSLVDLFTDENGYVTRKEGSLPYANPVSATNTIHKSASDATLNSEESLDKKSEQADILQSEEIQTDAAQTATLESSITWAVRSLVVGKANVSLTGDKVLAIKRFLDQVKNDMKISLNIPKVFVVDGGDETKNSSIRETKKLEMQRIQTRIELLKGHVNEAELYIKASRYHVNKEPKEADSLLKTWEQMLLWLRTDEIKELLHLVLVYEGDMPFQNNDEIQKTLEDLESNFVSDLFRFMFKVKLDELRHDGREHTSYVRIVPEQVAEELLDVFPNNINATNAVVKKLTGPALRINLLIQSINSLQQVATKSYDEIEKKRYSLLPTWTALYLPAATPNLIASTPNKFLCEMKDVLSRYHDQAKVLQSSQEHRKNNKTMKNLLNL